MSDLHVPDADDDFVDEEWNDDDVVDIPEYGYQNYDELDDEDDEEWIEFDVDFDEWCDDFADPGGRSSLRASSPSNPRNKPCPTCGRENVLTLKDVRLGYQCDHCADAAEGRLGGEY